MLQPALSPEESIQRALAFHDGTRLIEARRRPRSARIPESWVRREYKEYPRFTSVRLPRTKTSEFARVLRRRRSTRSFASQGIDLSILAAALDAAAREHVKGQRRGRAHPSAGARYPIETY